MLQNQAWLQQHYFPRPIHIQLSNWATENAKKLMNCGLQITKQSLSEEPCGEGCGVIYIETTALMGSFEARERGFIDFMILEIESSVQIASAHFEWQTDIEVPLNLFLKILQDNQSV